MIIITELIENNLENYYINYPKSLCNLSYHSHHKIIIHIIIRKAQQTLKNLVIVRLHSNPSNQSNIHIPQPHAQIILIAGSAAERVVQQRGVWGGRRRRSEVAGEEGVGGC